MSEFDRIDSKEYGELQTEDTHMVWLLKTFICDMYMFSALAAGILFLLITGIGQRVKGKRVNRLWGIPVLLLGLYLSAVFVVTLSPPISFSRLGANINLIPFASLDAIRGNPWNFWGNIVLFVPIGLLHFLLFNKSGKAAGTVLAGMGLSVFIETVQFFGVRAADIDDIILNTFGAFFGYLIGKAISSAFPYFYHQIGVFQIKKDRTRGTKGDKGKFRVLTVLIFFSVLLTGYAVNFDAGDPLQQLPALGAIKEPRVLDQEERPQIDIIAANAFCGTWMPTPYSMKRTAISRSHPPALQNF